MSATRTPPSAARRGRLLPGAGREGAVAACLIVAACAYVALEPWHGPIVLSLSEQHGVDAADLPALPLIALGLAVAWARGRAAGRRRPGAAAAAGLAVVLGALLLAGVLDPRIGSALTPAGGGTFGGNTEHVDGVRAQPIRRWTHLAVTYDGTSYRLYVNGAQASSGSASGPILRTTDPLWIGGNRPYGEHFQGVIDEARVYDRALGPAEVRAAMATPVGRRDGPGGTGLVAAYGFDAGRGGTAGDASGHGNAGAIRGARWTSAGRFGPGLSFGGRATVRVPASSSLALGRAMTLMAWIRPSEPQSGWRTVLARQTDAYFLAAGGGRQAAGAFERLDRVRFALILLLTVAIGFALASGHAPWDASGRRWYWPVALFVAGSLVDVAFAPRDTLIGPALVAAWCAVTASGRAERVAMSALAAVFAAVTVVSIAGQDSLPLPPDAGGVVRAAGLGLVLAAAALPRLRKTGPLRGVRSA